MKRFFVLAVMLIPVVAQPKPAPAPAKTTSKAAFKKAATPSSQDIPQGAVEVSPNTYTYTDKAGKKWIYHRTPFGLSKAEELPASIANAAAKRSDAAMPETQITDQGDAVKFVRPGPFGNYTWVKKKADFDDSDKAIFEAWQKKAEQAKAEIEPKKEQ